MDKLNARITKMLLKYESQCRARLEAYPNGSVIVINQHIKDTIVEEILKGVKEGILWSYNNKEIF